MLDEELLIAVVREQRVLWDKRCKDYRNRDLTKKAWKHVAETVGCTNQEAQVRWKNIRDSYSRVLKKIPIKRPGADDDVEYDWVHFKALHFLRDVIRHRKNTTVRAIEILPIETDNMDEDSNSTGLSSSAENQTCLQTGLDHFAVMQYATNDTAHTDGLLHNEIILPKDYPTSDVSNTDESKNIKHSDFADLYADLERQKIGLVKKEMEFQEDEDMNWFKSILPHMRTLPPLNKFSFRTKVQEMLFQELMKLNSQAATSTDPLSSTSSNNP